MVKTTLSITSNRSLTKDQSSLTGLRCLEVMLNTRKPPPSTDTLKLTIQSSQCGIAERHTSSKTANVWSLVKPTRLMASSLHIANELLRILDQSELRMARK